jgi:glycopeptide antibiotics resistance protein
MRKDKREITKAVKISKYIYTLVWILFLMYISFMIWRLFFYAYGNYHRSQSSIANMNLIPFKTIVNYIKGTGKYRFDVWLYNLLGNIVVFVPLGVMLPIVSIRFRKLRRVTIWAVMSIFLIEFLQMYTRVGIFDIDDIILNVIGVTIGYLIIIKKLNLNKIYQQNNKNR